MEEHSVYTRKVIGSSPIPPIPYNSNYSNVSIEIEARLSRLKHDSVSRSVLGRVRASMSTICCSRVFAKKMPSHADSYNVLDLCCPVSK